MPPVEQGYRYDVYISYSSADRAWASKLSNALERKGIEVFFDLSRSQAGARWGEELLEGLKASRHIVVLWSQNAARSDWVQREIAHFDIQIDDPISGQGPSNRRMIFLPLEAEPAAFTSFQMITDLREAGAYAEPADRVDPYLWRRVLDKVHDAIAIDVAILVPLAVLTMTREQLENLDLSHRPPLGEKSLGEVLRSIGIESKQELKQYYGARRTEWRPFVDGQLDVLTVLNGLRDDINKALENVGLNEAGFRWAPIGEDFWGNYEAFMKEVDKLRMGMLSVVVVDPLALYEEGVRERLNVLSERLRYAGVVYMIPLPSAVAKTQIRELVKQMAHPLFARLYKPTPQAFWLWDVTIGDEMDMKSVLLRGLERHLIRSASTRHTQVWQTSQL